ncbi:MAG: SRPBCC family protein, partial [Thermoleophilia bacterium]|nr:SRPBCC family protein [Thermoleophilia bacterium]
MGILKASRTVEIEVVKARCYEIVVDLGNTPEWQASMISSEVIETDSEGRAALVEIVSDAKVRNLTSRLAFQYQP